MARQHFDPQQQRLPLKQLLVPVLLLLVPSAPTVRVHEEGTRALPAGVKAVAGAANPYTVAAAFSTVKIPYGHTRVSANSRNGSSSLWRLQRRLREGGEGEGEGEDEDEDED